MESSGVGRRADKDVNATDEVIGMGCLLSGSPPFADPAPSKLCQLLVAILDMGSGSLISPSASSALAGVAQWFCLLSRAHFAVFDDVYAFNRQEPQHLPVQASDATFNEFCLFLALCPLLAADLSRPMAPIVAACDAAPEFGFGVSVAAAPIKLVKSLSRLSERRGDFIRLTHDDQQPYMPKERVGKVHKLALQKCDFK